MAVNPYQVKKEINGKEYTAQFSGLSAATNMIDECHIDDTSNISLTKLSDYVLKHGIVDPKGLTIDDFDSMDELNEVVGFGREVMQGKFRDSANSVTTETKGKR